MESNYKKSFRIVVSLFFLWGFITVFNDVLIAYFKTRYSLSDFESMFIQLFFFGAYGIGATSYYLFSKFRYDPINRLGYQNGMIYGALTAGIGCMLFYPMMVFDNYYINIIPLIVLGLGLTLLQIACNPYIILLGDEKNADGRLNLAQGLNSIGTALSPVIGGFFVFVYFSGKTAIQVPFLFCGLLFILAAFLVKRANLPSFQKTESKSNQHLKNFPQLKWGMLAVFLYVGAEVAIGSKLIDYGKTPEGGALSEFTASQILGFYWGGAMVGRLMLPILKSGKLMRYKILFTFFLILGGALLLSLSISLSTYFTNDNVIEFSSLFISNTILAWPFISGCIVLFIVLLLFYSNTKKTLGMFALINIFLLSAAFIITGVPGLWLIVLVGLFNSIMWSNIFVIATDGLGNYKSRGSSLLIVMIIGGAVFPMFMGLVADQFDLRIAYLLPIISYLYILLFSQIRFNKNE